MMFINDKKTPLYEMVSYEVGTSAYDAYGKIVSSARSRISEGGMIKTNNFNFAIKKIDLNLGKEIFNKTELMKDAQQLETNFTDFANHLMDANATVNSLLNQSDASAVFGVYGAALLNLWNENAATFGDFKLNFEAWSKAIAVISAQNENTEAEVIRQYADRGDTLSYRSYSNGSYTYGSVKDIPSDTEIDFDGDGKTDLLVESAPSAVVDNSFSISKGDTCFVNNEEYQFFGRCDNCNYFVKDGQVYRQEADGVLKDLNISADDFNTGQYALDHNSEWYTSFSTSTENAAALGFPDQDSIIRGVSAGDTVTFGDTEYTYIGEGYGDVVYYEKNGQVYIESGDGVVPVEQELAAVQEEVANNRNEMYSAVDASSAYVLPQNITAAEANQHFQTAIDNREAYIEINNTLESKAVDIWTVDIKAGENGKVLLAYDKGTDMYYQVDDNGTYVVQPGNGYKPDDLKTYDVAHSKHTDAYSQM